MEQYDDGETYYCVKSIDKLYLCSIITFVGIGILIVIGFLTIIANSADLMEDFPEMVFAITVICIISFVIYIIFCLSMLINLKWKKSMLNNIYEINNKLN